MTLPDLCEPVFEHLCRLSRRHRAGDAPPSRNVREELANLLTDLRARASLDPVLRAQFERAEPAIILCIDHAVRTSGWPCGRNWRPGTPEVADDDPARFFVLLQNDLDDPSEAADERLEVLAACAALAFAGPGMRDAHRAALDQLRLRLAIDAPIGERMPARIIGEDLTRPSPGPAIAAVAIALAILAVGSSAFSQRWDRASPDSTGHDQKGGGVAAAGSQP